MPFSFFRMEKIIPQIACTNLNGEEKPVDDPDELINGQRREQILRSPPCPMLESGSNHHVNLQDKSGKSLLIHSCARGLKESVEELAKDPNIDANLEDIEGNTALIHAAQAGHTQIVELLIHRFANVQVDHVNKLGQTALIKAAIQGRANCARILLRAGADPFKRDNGRQFNAMEWAEFVGRKECAKVIGEFLGPKRRAKMALPKAQNNLKQVACLAAIPLISGECQELPASVRPRFHSAPPTPCVKIKITPPSSPLFPPNYKMETFPHQQQQQQQLPYKAIMEARALMKQNRPKSSCN